MDRAKVRTAEAERVSPDQAPETPGVPVGNHHNKYASTNPAIRWLTTRFLDRLDSVLDAAAAEAPTASVAEIGCGEGEIATRLLDRWPDVTALDLPDAGLRRRWAELTGPRFVHGDALRLPFPDNSVDVIVSIEVLEHLPDPAVGLAEYARVARRGLILSVPREPIFRIGNLMAGRHIRALGNTPGHFNHWSAPDFLRFVSNVGSVREVEKPLPWTIAWVRLT